MDSGRKRVHIHCPAHWGRSSRMESQITLRVFKTNEGDAQSAEFIYSTYSKQQSPSWEANRFSASQEMLRILWSPKVHYRINNSPPSIPILSQINPVCAPHPTSWKSILILSSQSKPGSYESFLSLRFPHQNPVYTSPVPTHATCPAHLILLDLTIRTYWVRITNH